eukprot:6205058-Heterocapsa_arctica.AAC.1
MTLEARCLFTRASESGRGSGVSHSHGDPRSCMRAAIRPDRMGSRLPMAGAGLVVAQVLLRARPRALPGRRRRWSTVGRAMP